MLYRTFLLAQSLGFALVAGSAAWAQDTSAPDITDGGELPLACFLEPAKLDQEAVEAFLARPQSLLDRNGFSTVALSSEARALAGSDARTVDALIEVAREATEQQRAAIGAGLARAALACVGESPEFAAYIQERVSDSGLEGLVVAFVAAAADLETAAIRLIPGGAPNSVGPVGGGGVAEGGQNMVFRSEGIPVEDGVFEVEGNGGFTPSGDNSDLSATTNLR